VTATINEGNATEPDVRKAVREVLFKRLGYHPHPGQRKIHNSPARHRVASCGRRFGKSVVGGMELCIEAYMTHLMLPILNKTDRRREFWIVGPEYTDSAKEFRVAYNALKRLKTPFDRPGTYYNERTGDMQISLYDGKFIVLAKSAAKPERLVGEGLNGVIMAEAAKQKEETWLRFIRPTLADFRGWSLHTSTPEGKNWFYGLWDMGQSVVEEEWESWRMPSWRNTFVFRQKTTDADVQALQNWLEAPINSKAPLPRELADAIDPEVLSQIRDLTSEAFNQEVGAGFSDFVGRVFKEFDEEIHVRDFRWNPAWPTYAAVDYGFTNPFVWLVIQVNPYDGGVWVVDELYETGLTIEEAASEIEARGLVPPGLRDFYPDPASPEHTRALEARLKLRSHGGTGGELNTRIRAIRQAMKVRNLHLPYGHDLRAPRLFFNRKCVRTIADMSAYRYPKMRAESEANVPENPMKKDDHGPEALGRFFAGYWGHPDGAQGGTRVSSGAYSR
jgi:hypothetical protein